MTGVAEVCVFMKPAVVWGLSLAKPLRPAGWMAPEMSRELFSEPRRDSENLRWSAGVSLLSLLPRLLPSTCPGACAMQDQGHC